VNPKAIGRETRDLLENRYEELDSVPAVIEFLARIERFAATLALWGSRTNLTAHPEDPSEVAFHIIDSLAPLTIASHPEGSILRGCFTSGRRVLDLGSGAGFPGLVLAAACEAHFTLVEARHKRASFLKTAATEMGLDNVTVLHRPDVTAYARQRNAVSLAAKTNVSRETFVHRSDATPSVVGLSPDHIQRPEKTPTDAGLSPDQSSDVVLGRAFAKPAVFCRSAAKLLREGGFAMLYAGRGQPLEDAAAGTGLTVGARIPYEVRRGDHVTPRILVLFQR